MAETGLLYVGAVLFLNGTSLLGWSKGNSNAPLNVLVGILQVVTPFFIIFTSNGDAATILGAVAKDVAEMRVAIPRSHFGSHRIF